MSRARERRGRQLTQAFARAYENHQESPSVESWFELGVLLSDVYDDSNDWGEAAVKAANPRLDPARFTPVSCWKRVTKLQPDHAMAWLRLGRAYREIWDDQQNAKRCFAKAVAADTTLVEAWVGMGFATLPGWNHDLSDRQLRKALFETEAYFTRAIAESLEEAAAHDVFLYLAECANRVDDLEQAVRWYAKGAELGIRWYEREHAKLARKLKRKKR